LPTPQTFAKHKTKRSANKVAGSTTSEDLEISTNRRLVKKKSVSMASLLSKESDSEDNKHFPFRLNAYSRSLRGHHLPESLGPVAMHSIPRDTFEMQLPKSRSLACLAAATVAQMAHPLMIKEARSRSYLVGSVGHTSMLGSEELERYFPERKLKLFVGSWNMNGQTPPVYLSDFLLPQNIEFVPDLLVIGTQECMGETKEWEARLQDTLGPSHVLYHSHGLGTLHLAIFLRRDLVWFCSVPEVDSFSTRPGSTFKTKGAVAIAFLLFGTSFLFVNSHLTAHQENVRDRIKDLTKINAMLHLPRSLPIRKRHRNLADNFDCAFWCGDLNFRIEQTREVVIREVQDGISVLEFDQLNYLRSEDLIFSGYTEDPIRFIPTYKYDPGTNNFDTSSKQRVPSYTDRILYKCHKSTPVTPLHYDIVQDVVTSDHKPVWGMWETVLRPGKDSVPLSGGLFNREIYLEGLKRRSEALKPLTKGRLNMNNMCTLQ
jgi:phosphatidylinositol-bisphosphatase